MTTPTQTPLTENYEFQGRQEQHHQWGTHLHVWHPVLVFGLYTRFLWPGATRVIAGDKFW
jgi:hypothetical protein